MDLSLFLAKLIGVYLIIMSLFLFVRRDLLKTVASDLANNSALLAVTGALNLIFGLLIVFTHNIWEWNYKVLITLFGYLGVVAGLVRLFVPEWSKNMIRSMGDTAFVVYGVVFLVIGLFLAYIGFGF